MNCVSIPNNDSMVLWNRKMSVFQSWKQLARKFKHETYALYLACRDQRTPWYARLMAAAVVAYAFSPIDLIPDFIPVLGLLDDFVLVPLGIMLVCSMIPAPVMEDCRRRAREEMYYDKPVSWAAAVVVIGVWVLLAGLGYYLWTGHIG